MGRPSLAATIDSTTLSIFPTFRSKDRINGEIYVFGRSLLFNSWDSKSGLVYRNYALNFDGVSNLEATSIGVNFEEIIFPFKKLLFLGLRLDLSADWLSTMSKDKIREERQYIMPALYYNGILSSISDFKDLAFPVEPAFIITGTCRIYHQ